MNSLNKNTEFKLYKENFEQMKKLPYVKFLLKQNKRLERENADLKNTVLKLCKKVLIKEEKKENIVYEIVDDEEIIVLDKKEVVIEEVVVEEQEEQEEEEQEEEEEEQEQEEEEQEVEQEVEQEEEEQEEEEEEVYEIKIKSKTYYVTNEIDSVIYEADKNGDISEEVGKYANGKPVFYKK